MTENNEIQTVDKNSLEYKAWINLWQLAKDCIHYDEGTIDFEEFFRCGSRSYDLKIKLDLTK